jgi:O-acetyl-ADP-ribose deacetylase (regulator of RNase III)
MKRLEELICELYNSQSREKNMEVLSRIRDLLNSCFIVPVGQVDSQIVYRRLSIDDGSDVFVAFTSNEMFELGEMSETEDVSVSKLLSDTLKEDGVKGIIINPWKNSYYLPKVLIEMIMDGKNLLSEIKIVKGDITTFDGDCIVNADNESLLGGGGVDGAIHRAAGPELFNECKLLNGCKTGQAKITKGYNLPCEYVIHTVGPIYSGKHEDEHMLMDCYGNSLDLAKKYDIHSIAFPCISCGAYGYPIEDACKIALNTMANWLDRNNEYTMKICVYCFEEEIYKAYEKLTTYEEESI